MALKVIKTIGHYRTSNKENHTPINKDTEDYVKIEASVNTSVDQSDSKKLANSKESDINKLI